MGGWAMGLPAKEYTGLFGYPVEGVTALVSV